MSGSSVAKQKTFKDGDMWRAYFRASQSFKDLDQEVQKYDEWKDKQK